MKEFEKHIEFYRQSYGYQHFSRLIPEDKWGDWKLAEIYLQKYWLPEQEYLNIWRPLQNAIFIQGKNVPDLIYHNEFQMIIVNGGCLFSEDNFLQLKKAMQEMGEEHFVVIQNNQEYTSGEPVFRMKFPTNITWKEITSGNYISAVLLEMSFNEYYVFGVNGKWGKYSATDYIRPLDIIGFQSEFAPIFNEVFKQSNEERQEIQKWIPDNYKKLLK